MLSVSSCLIVQTRSCFDIISSICLVWPKDFHSVHATDCLGDSQTGECSPKWYFQGKTTVMYLGKRRCCQGTSKDWMVIATGGEWLGERKRGSLKNIWRGHQKKSSCYGFLLYNILIHLHIHIYTDTSWILVTLIPTFKKEKVLSF